VLLAPRVINKLDNASSAKPMLIVLLANHMAILPQLPKVTPVLNVLLMSTATLPVLAVDTVPVELASLLLPRTVVLATV